jgi:hypothetical protein
MKLITVNIEPQYGKWVYYPACSDAKVFAEIAGTKTLTEQTLAHIRELGYEVKASAKSLDELIGSMVR